VYLITQIPSGCFLRAGEDGLSTNAKVSSRARGTWSLDGRRFMTNKFIAVLIFVLFSFSAIGNAGKPGMTFNGSFTNMKFDNEHAYGSEVELWKDANDIFGLFLHSEGLAGDTPT